MSIVARKPEPKIPFKYSMAKVEGLFLKVGRSQGWLNEEGPIVLAVSGGSDSIAMLWLFHLFRNKNLIVAHLDHGIRGEESKEDGLFVEAMAGRFNIKCIKGFRPVPELLKKGESLEDGARRIRYEFLEEVRKNAGAGGIAVAHTEDDSVETFLHNLFRGSGVRGLTGIPEKRGFVFRPLLHFSRKYLRELLSLYAIPWREDSTNEDTTYMRNKIRNVLMPLIEKEINRAAAKHILGTAGDLAFFRAQEENIQRSLVNTLSLALPFSSYTCHFSSLRRLDEGTKALFLRGVGRVLGLKVLSRDRTEKLLQLFEKNHPWCFQWQKDMFVFGTFPFVNWVNPAILTRLDSKEVKVSLKGDRGEFLWNNWTISWRKGAPSNCFNGWMRAVIASTDEFTVIPLADSVKSGMIWAPFWGRHICPVVQGSAMDEWVPFWGKRKNFDENFHGNGAVIIEAKYPRILL